MTDEELAGQPGGLATRPEDEADDGVAEPVFTPKDFRLNLGARLGAADESLADPSAATTSVCPSASSTMNHFPISTAQRYVS